MVKTRLHAVPTSDPHYNSVVLLLPFDGNDADTNTTDESRSIHVIEFKGTAQIDTAQSKWGGSSLLLDGNSDYLDIPDSSDFFLGSQDFTFETWIRFNALDVTQFICSSYRNTGDDRAHAWVMDSDNRTRFFWSIDGIVSSNHRVSDMPTVTTGVWHHAAVVKSNGIIIQFWDGVELTRSAGESDPETDIFDSSEPFRIGAIDSSGIKLFVNGHIDDFRLTLGLARYKGDFVPIRGPVPFGDQHFDSVAILLPLNDSDGATSTTDFSSHSHTPFTFSASAQIDTAQSKFGTSSLLLDGNSDFITIPDDAAFTVGSGDFTLEVHVRFNALPSTSTEQGYTMMSHYRNTTNQRSWFWGFTETDEMEFFWSLNGVATFSVITTDVPTLVVDTWYHTAMCRDGTTVRLFLDGTELTSSGDSISTSTLHNSTEAPRIGNVDSSTNFRRFTNGWIDNVRMTVGLARYTGDFVPPLEEYPTS